MKWTALASVVLLIFFAACTQKTDEERFQDVEKSLMASVADLTIVPSKVELTNEPYIKGKVAVFQELEKTGPYVKAGTYLMQPSYFREMKDFYATTPEEVGTVALVSCQTVQKGVYRIGDKETPAMVEDCDLTLIDRSKPAIIYRKRFEKTPEQEKLAYGDSVVKQSAQSEVQKFLSGLPRV